MTLSAQLSLLHFSVTVTDSYDNFTVVHVDIFLPMFLTIQLVQPDVLCVQHVVVACRHPADVKKEKEDILKRLNAKVKFMYCFLFDVYYIKLVILGFK